VRGRQRAQRIYARFGFTLWASPQNYTRSRKDALIMWTDDIRERAFRQRIVSIVNKLPEGIRPA
jgi:hypothetical protein